ncbi:MAG: DUF3099 domain-containing protein [Nocardioides sp.]
MARHQTDEPVRITTANAGRDADIAARQKRYLIAMGIRTICFVAAIFVTSIWLRVVFVTGALVLPYVAVVMANAGSTKSDGFALMDGPSGARELPPGDGSA